MLGRPAIGWVHVQFGNINIGPASYVMDIPTVCLDTFIGYFSGNQKKFHLELDSEGYYIGVVEFNETLYRVSNDVPSGLNITEIDGTAMGLDLYASNEEILTHMAKELISDVKEDLDEWVVWECDDMSDEEKINRCKMLLEKCHQLEDLIQN